MNGGTDGWTDERARPIDGATDGRMDSRMDAAVIERIKRTSPPMSRIQKKKSQSTPQTSRIPATTLLHPPAKSRISKVERFQSRRHLENEVTPPPHRSRILKKKEKAFVTPGVVENFGFLPADIEKFRVGSWHQEWGKMACIFISSKDGAA